MRLLYNIIFFLFLATNGYAQGPQDGMPDDPDLMLDIGWGPSSVGVAFYSGFNLQFKRLVVTPNYIGSRTNMFQISSRRNKFSSIGILAGWAFPGDVKNMLFVVSTGFSYNTLTKYRSSGFLGSGPETNASEYSFGLPVHIKFYVPTKSAIGVYAGARADFNGIDNYTVLILGLRMGRVGHWDW